MVSIRRPEHRLGSQPKPRGANMELEKTRPKGESCSVGWQDETVIGEKTRNPSKAFGWARCNITGAAKSAPVN